MSAALQQFEFSGTLVRTLLVDGEPCFVARDLCTVLEIRNTADAVASLDSDEKGVATTDTLGGAQQMTYVTEAGMYSLVLRSRKPEAKAFKRWITHEVLPKIRQTGSYGAAPASHPDMLTRADLARMVLEAEEEKAAAVAQLEAAAPKVAYHDRYVANDDAVTVKVWAAQFGLTEPQARKLLLDAKVVYSQVIGQKWSARENRVVEVREYRAYARYIEWFDLRPQHNAPRHHNGQVRQTLYVRQEAALQLGQKLGLEPLGAQAQPTLEVTV